MKLTILIFTIFITVQTSLFHTFGQVYSRPKIVSDSAKDECDAQKFTVFGLQIGMTLAEVGKVFNVEIKTLPRSLGEFDGSEGFSYFAAKGDTMNLPSHLDYLWVEFHKDKIYAIKAFYSVQNPKSLLSEISSQWGLMEDQWLTTNEKSSSQSIFVCKNTKVEILDSSGVRLYVEDKSIKLIHLPKRIKEDEVPFMLRESVIIPKKEVVQPKSKTENSSKPEESNKQNKPNQLPEKCSLPISLLPPIRGLSLAMSKVLVFNNYPNCRNEITSNCSHRAERIANASLRNGLDAVTIGFDLESQTVSSFSIIYDTSLEWQSSKEFAESISDNLEFDPNKWIPKPTNKKSPFVSLGYACTNYGATVSFIDGYPRLSLYKSTELIKLEESYRKANLSEQQKKKKKEFKP